MFARSLVVAAFLAVSVSADGHLSNETDMPMMNMTEEPMMEMNMTEEPMMEMNMTDMNMTDLNATGSNATEEETEEPEVSSDAIDGSMSVVAALVQWLL